MDSQKQKQQSKDLFINEEEEINPSLLSMAGTIALPSKEELDSDPRLAAAFGYSGDEE